MKWSYPPPPSPPRAQTGNSSITWILPPGNSVQQSVKSQLTEQVFCKWAETATNYILLLADFRTTLLNSFMITGLWHVLKKH